LERARNNIMKAVFKALIGVFIIAIFLFNFEQSSLTVIAENLSISTLFLSCFLIILSTFPTLMRWLFIAKRNHIFSPILNLTYFYYAGFFFNSISPANLGGDLFKFLSVKKSTASTNEEIINILLQERIYGFISLIFIVSFGLFFSPNYFFVINGFPIKPPIYFLCFFIFTILLFKKNFLFFLSQIKHLYKLTSYINTNRASLIYDLVIIALSFLGFLFWVSSIFLICQELNINLGFSNILIIAGLVEIIRFIPLTFQGIGVREPSFALLASEFFGCNFELAFVSGLIIYSCLSLVNMMLGVAFYSSNNQTN